MRNYSLVWVAATVLAAACGGEEGSGGAPEDSLTQLIGPEGGTLELRGGGKVEIPAGALMETVSIKLTELEEGDVAPLPTHLEASGKPLAFEPFDLVFALPVKVTVPFVGNEAEVRPLKANDTRDMAWQTIVGADKTPDSKLEMNTTRSGVYFPVRPRRDTGVVTLPDGAVVVPGDAGLDGAIDDPKTVIGLIGPEGGSVELLSGAKVEVPAGALVQAIGIKITELEITDVAPLPSNLEPAGKPFAFEPHGLMFAMPVKVTVPFTGDPTEVRPVKARDETDPAWQTIVDATKTPDAKLELNTSAFSVYFPVRPRRGSGVITLPDGGIVEQDGGSDAGGLDGAIASLCAADNGGCDPLVTCSEDGVATMCGPCPSNYAGDGVLGCSPLLVSLSLSAGTLTPALDAATTDYDARVSFATQTITLTPTAVVGANIAVNGDPVASGATWQSTTLDLGDNAISIVVSQAGQPSRTYTLTVTRSSMQIAQEAYVKASNPGAADEFGYRVAISGDTMVVGARLEDSNARGVDGDESNDNATWSGAAYVFVRSGSTWSQQAYLKASNADANDLFGYSVAIDGDTLVVGAQGEGSNATGVNGNESDNSAVNAGAAYVFVRNGSAWTQQAYLKASNTAANDIFGNSVAISGETIAIGANYEDSAAVGINGDDADNSANSSGAVYVFVRSGTNWTQQAYVKASNTQSSDDFGQHLAIDGDTLVVGARSEDSNAIGVDGIESDNSSSGSGAAYVFVRNAGLWSQQAYLKASNTDASDSFAWNVAVSGDTIVVGAPQEDSNALGVNGNESDNSAASSGAAYVFIRNAGLWSQQAYLKASNAGAGDWFGWTVAIAGDQVLVGAPFEGSIATGVNGDGTSNAAAEAGAAYLFVRNGGAWSQAAYIKSDNGQAGDRFGWSVAISADTAAVCAQMEDSNATGSNGDGTNNSVADSGAVYVFR